MPKADKQPVAGQTVTISEQFLFHTPESMAEIEEWVLALPATERLPAMTAMWMYNNLLASAGKVEIARNDA